MVAKPDKNVPASSMLDDNPAAALAVFCPDLDQWPERWHYDEPDILPGQQIVAFITPFLLHLLGEDLSPKTRRRHRDNAWLLGGELIRLRYEDRKLSKLDIALALSGLISEDGGPMIYPRISDADQNAFDATCRKLYRFLDSDQKRVRQK